MILKEVVELVQKEPSINRGVREKTLQGEMHYLGAPNGYGNSRKKGGELSQQTTNSLKLSQS